MKKNITRKFISGITIFTLIAGLLAGCGSTAADEAKKQDTTTSSVSDDTETVGDSASELTNSNTDKITIYAATGGSPKPFTFVNEEGELEGHNIELIQAIFDRLPQYELDLEVTDFPSIFAGLDSDRYQIGVNNFAMNDERKEKYLFTDPIFENSYVAIFAKDDERAQTITSWEDLGGLSTISESGINITTALENYNTANPDNQVTIDYSEEDLVLQIQDVEAGKYDFVLMDKPMFQYYQNEFNFNVTGVEIGEEVAGDLMQEPYSYLIVSAGNEQLVEDINAALKEVIEEGVSKEINEKWFGADYSPAYN